MTAWTQTSADPQACEHCHSVVRRRWDGDAVAAVAALLRVEPATAGYFLALNGYVPCGDALRSADSCHHSVLAAARHIAGRYGLSLDIPLVEELLTEEIPVEPALVEETAPTEADWDILPRHVEPIDLPDAS